MNFVLMLTLASSLYARSRVDAQSNLMVKLTLVRDADAVGAVCLDGSLPAYHLHRGSGDGEKNWLLQFEGGGWCNDVKSCFERAETRRGSSRYMNKYAVFSGILSDNRSLNPDFYNWNRVKLRYCDGASFSGDSTYRNGTSQLFFRGARIWHAIIRDLLPKGLSRAHMALLSGCSAGGLSSFLHCQNFTRLLSPGTTVKCLSDAGFFLDVKDISGAFSMRSFYENLISLQGIENSLDKNCMNSATSAVWCFFPQYVLNYITAPFFVLNAAYDVFQFHHGLVPPKADKEGRWFLCVRDPGYCNAEQIAVLRGFRRDMLRALQIVNGSSNGGMFVNSCFAHCQSESQDTWLAPDSPRLKNKTIAEVVGDWYFERKIAKEVDCPYACDSKCHNLIPLSSSA